MSVVIARCSLYKTRVYAIRHHTFQIGLRLARILFIYTVFFCVRGTPLFKSLQLFARRLGT